MFKVSPSGIGMLLECPRCLWLHYREEIKRPSGVFPSLPGGMDGMFKVYFDEWRAKGELPPEIAGKVEGKLFDDMEKLSVWRNNWKGMTAEIPEYDILLKGAVDDMLVMKDGTIAPFDFKTRGYPTKEDTHEHYRTQIALYSLLFQRNGLNVAKDGYLLFFWPSAYEKNSASFTTELIRLSVSPDNGMEILKRVHAIISGAKPEAADECPYCEYRDTAAPATLF